jgi:polyphenol oxidase
MPFLQSSISNHPSSASWSYYYLPRVDQSGMVHGFMTRSSGGIIASQSERERFVEALGAASAIVLQQLHGTDMHAIRDGERPVIGDGLVLMEKGVVGIIKTADCLPVILYDPSFPMAAIVHAGWRGTVQGITGKAIDLMVGLGADRGRMGAILGPGIGRCCYRVGPEVIADFRHAGFSDRNFTKVDKAFFLDLKAANREMIEAEGVNRIDDIGLCTSCRQDLFFSARNDKQAGRLVNFVLLKR